MQIADPFHFHIERVVMYEIFLTLARSPKQDSEVARPARGKAVQCSRTLFHILKKGQDMAV